LDQGWIEFSGVRKRFGEKVVYSGLDVRVERGSALTVVGGSGVGKSVMLKMLIGLLKPDSGTIVFAGGEVTKMGEGDLSRLRQRIAMLFQGGALFDECRSERRLRSGGALSLPNEQSRTR
jgi:phospholipid/cholesterol/gamma-HCH transport system ATP-binding protein